MVVMHFVCRRPAADGNKRGRETLRTNLQPEAPLSARHEAHRDERSQSKRDDQQAAEPALLTQRCEPGGHSRWDLSRVLYTAQPVIPMAPA